MRSPGSVSCLTVALWLAGGVAAHAQQGTAPSTGEFTGEFTAHGFDVVRVENEFKLSLPAEETEAVWSHLQERYGADTALLTELHAGLTATLSDEKFRDQYFDDSELSLLAAQSGIRHRRRLNLGNAADRKSGRELVQVKLQRPGGEARRVALKASNKSSARSGSARP